jgi:N-methylhydantoinase A
MRYAGQGFEVTVPLPAGRLDGSRAAAVSRAFLAVYRERYGQATRDQPLEIVSWRVRARGPLPRIPVPRIARASDLRAARAGRRPVWFESAGRYVETPVYPRERLGAGARLRGPAVIEERESTLVVPPDARLAIDATGTAILTLARPAT